MRAWLGVALLFAVVYLVVGLGFGELAFRATSERARVSCRRAAWLVSAVCFVLHVGYERSRRRESPSRAALHAAGAAAVGAGALAGAALIRALATGTGRPDLLGLALIAWPLITVIPAFLAGWAIALVLPDRRLHG